MLDKLLLFLLLSIGSLHAQTDSLDLKIRKMLEVTGAAQRFEMVMDQLIDMQEDNYQSSIGQEFWDVFREEIKTKGYTQITKLLAPVYKKHLTVVEMDAIIAFYSSEAGQSMVNKFPLISQEARVLGEQWGEELGQEILAKIENSDELKFNIVLDDCDAFKEGKFTYKTKDERLVNFTRKNNVQTEVFDYGELKARVEWVTRCSYKLWELDDNDEELQIPPLEVNIYEINGNSYKFISTKEGYDFSSKGEITKIED